MEIKATNSAFFNAQTVDKLQDLINKLETSLFKAIVSAKIGQETFVINTKVGSLPITTSLELLQGDELSLKIKPKNGSLPTLEISKIERPLSAHKQVIQKSTLTKQTPLLLSNKIDIQQLQTHKAHFVAKVISTEGPKINLKTLSGEFISLAKDNFKQLTMTPKAGDLLVIKQHNPQQIEIQPLSKQQVLTQAQQQLIPKQLEQAQPFKQLTQIAFKLFQNINNEIKHNDLKHKLQNTHSKTVPEGTHKNTPKQNSEAPKNPTPNNNNSNTPKASINKAVADTLKLPTDTIHPSKAEAASKKSEAAKIMQPQRTADTLKIDFQTLKIDVKSAIKTIENNLHKLVTKHSVTPQLLKSESINRLLSQLISFAKTPQSDAPTKTLVHQISLINKSVDELLVELDKTTMQKKSKEDEQFIDVLKSAIKDLKQPIEITINKLLMQSVSAKITQESNNPLLINTQIPVEIDKQTKDVKLKIKQNKKSSTTDDDDNWEIHLSFEFGLLGLISTKIILSNNFEVNVQFWAELVNTKTLLDHKQNIFKQQMKNSGFLLQDIQIYLGKKIEDDVKQQMPERQLIDIKV